MKTNHFWLTLAVTLVGLLFPMLAFADPGSAAAAAGGAAQAAAGLAAIAAGAAADLPTLAQKFKDATDKVKEIAEDLTGKAARGEAVSQGAKEKADEAILKMTGLQTQIEAIEQKMARGGTGAGDGERQKSLGEQFVESDGFKSFEASGFAKSARGADMQVKTTLTSLTTDAAGSVGDGINQTRFPGILPLAQRRLTVVDLLSPGQMDGNTLEYVKETGFTNGAGMVAEGGTKPESDIKLDLVTTSAKVIAHWMKASKQVLSDVSQLRSMIDERLLYGLALKKEDQVLNGDGTGQNLLGIIAQATAYALPSGITAPAGESKLIDMLRIAMLQAVLAEYPATGHVLNPIDWAKIEMAKDEYGRYLIGNPQGTLNPTLWGLPVVQTQAIAVDKFLTGAFKQGAQYFDRWQARIEVGYVNDDFIKNFVTILGEERGALAVYRPEAFVYGDFGDVV